jgi:transposase-like protein
MAANTSPAKHPSQRRYTPDFKAKVVAFYQEHGQAATVREFKVCRQSVWAWARAAGVATNLGTKPSIQKAGSAAAAMRAERKATLVDLAYKAAEHHVTKSLNAQEGRDAERWTMAFCQAADKYLLLIGEPTKRSDQHVTIEEAKEKARGVVLSLIRTADAHS